MFQIHKLSQFLWTVWNFFRIKIAFLWTCLKRVTHHTNFVYFCIFERHFFALFMFFANVQNIHFYFIQVLEWVLWSLIVHYWRFINAFIISKYCYIMNKSFSLPFYFSIFLRIGVIKRKLLIVWRNGIQAGKFSITICLFYF